MNQQDPDPNRGLFEEALRRFDEENSRDPRLELKNGISVPRELAYSEWLSAWVLRLKPDASEALRLAARAAHLCRWLIPRETHPMNRAGYLRWRQELKKLHAQKGAEILREVGYPEDVVASVQALILKSGYPEDPDSRVLEDGLCLVFLEHQFGALAKKSTDDKVTNALQKAWKKMTPVAQAVAMTLDFEPHEKELLARAFGRPLP